MNRAQRRAMRNAPKKYAESDMRRAAREAAEQTAHHSTDMILSALCLALHDCYGFGQRRCMRVLESINDYTFNALCAHELMDKCKATVKIEIVEGEANES